MLSPNSTVAELIDHSCGEWKEALVKQICISFSIFHLLNGDWVVFLLIQFFFCGENTELTRKSLQINVAMRCHFNKRMNEY